MKTYTVTVNGIAYDVAVEETTGRQVNRVAAPAYTAPAPTPIPAVVPAPVLEASPAPVPVEAPAPAVVTGGTKGKLSVDAPMPGKILSIKAAIGQAVKRGDVLLILEAMKMENEIVAPEDGVIASVDISAGDNVESGTLLATLN